MKIRKLKSIKIKHNLAIAIFLVFTLSVYAFFFTANNWLYESINVKATTIGSSQTFENRTVTIGKWEYSEVQNLMEIELAIDNLAYDGIDEYDFSVAINPSTKNAEIVEIISKDNYIVIQIENVPENFTEISLRMSFDGASDTLKLYTNKEEVTYVDELLVKTYAEYQIDGIYRNIESYENQITSYQDLIEDEETTITNIQKSILTDEESKAYKTEEEIAEINSSISSKYSTIETKQKLIISYNYEIEQLEEKIENAQNQIKDLSTDES